MRVRASYNEFFPTKYNGTWTKDSFSNASEPVKEKLTLEFWYRNAVLWKLGYVWKHFWANARQEWRITLQSKKHESKHGGFNCRTRLVERSYRGYMPPPFSDQNEVVDSKGWAVLMFASTTCRSRYLTSALSLEVIRHAVSGNAPSKFSSSLVLLLF